MESQSDSTQIVSSLKLPMLKTRDYDLWNMRMEQYLTHTDYTLWEVIVNGDAPVVYEAEIKSQSSSNSNSQNVAFVSSENTSSINKAVNTALDVSTASTQGQASSSTYADDVMFSFFVNQSKSLLLDNEYMDQIDSDDLEEMDLKWQVAMLTIRIKRFI
ncbi:hypothetical protein Tco_0637891 [Tanacetum coccineum]